MNLRAAFSGLSSLSPWVSPNAPLRAGLDAFLLSLLLSCTISTGAPSSALSETSWRFLIHLASDWLSTGSCSLGLKLYSVSRTKPGNEWPAGVGGGKQGRAEWKGGPKPASSWLKPLSLASSVQLKQTNLRPFHKKGGCLRTSLSQLSIPSWARAPDFSM